MGCGVVQKTGCGHVTKLAEQFGITPGVNVLEDVSKNFDGAGIQVKVTPLEKDMTVIQHRHSYDHLSILLSGSVILQNDGMTTILNASKGPVSIIIEAGQLHALTALTDNVVWMCIHKDGVQ
jgi:quercetin dioxygenase-like cupin family protein